MTNTTSVHYHAGDDSAVKPRIAGLFLMPMRWVCAWILFASAWRRLVLKPESLNPHSPSYEGIKLIHFLPHTDFLAAGLKYTIVHPTLLHVFLWAFTCFEAILGILLFLGLFSRLVGLTLFGVFANLMLVAGWLGSTCLDEWTVATFGMAFGLSLFLSGSGPYSLDTYLYKRFHRLASHAWFGWLVSPELAFIHEYKKGKVYALLLSITMLAFTLYTNQHFVGGVYGPFHNPAILPNLSLNAKLMKNGNLNLDVYRNQGPDTYGSFIISIAVKNSQQKVIVNFNPDVLGIIPQSQIHNQYPVKIESNGYALVVPLGAHARVQLYSPELINLPAGEYTIVVTDISGINWHTATVVY